MYTLQNPPTENQDAGQFDLHWAIPAISPSERYFLSQLISSPSKEVRLNKGYFASYKRIILDKITVLEMKIWIYWSKSNSWIYFYIVLNKNWKMYWSEQSLLVLGRRRGAHREDWNNYRAKKWLRNNSLKVKLMKLYKWSICF